MKFSNGDENSPIESLCWFCKKKHAKADLVSILTMKQKILEILGLEVKDYEKNSEICTSCVITMNQMYDNRLKMRSSFYNIKARTYCLEGNREMILECLNQKTNESPPKQPDDKKDFTNINNGNGPQITEVRSAILDFSADDLEEEENTNTINIRSDSTPSAEELIRPLGKDYQVRVTSDKLIPTTILKCNDCSKTYKTERYFLKHVAGHARKRAALANKSLRKGFTCNECGESFVKISELKLHRKTHRCYHKCPTCAKQFTIIFDLEWHIAMCDGVKKAQTGIRRRTRSECSIKYQQSEIDDSECGTTEVDTICSATKNHVKRFIEDSKFVEQSIIEDNNIETISNISEETYFSSVSKKFDRKRKLPTSIPGTEIDIINNTKKIIFQKKNNVIYSIKKIDEFKCDLCEYRSKTISDIMKHEIQYHKQLPLFICDECNFTFTHMYYLGIHEFSHNKPVQCHICYESCVTRFELKLHINRHLKTTYDCNICNRIFYRKCDLIDHIQNRLHSNSAKIKVNYKKEKNIKSCMKKRKSYQCRYLIQEPSEPYEKLRRYEYNNFKCRLYDGREEKVIESLPYIKVKYKMDLLKHYRWYQLRKYFKCAILKRRRSLEELLNFYFTNLKSINNFNNINLNLDMPVNLFEVEDNCTVSYENHIESGIKFYGIPSYCNFKTIDQIIDEDIYDDYNEYNEAEFYR